jgi:hypothetical protein
VRVWLTRAVHGVCCRVWSYEVVHGMCAGFRVQGLGAWRVCRV